VVLWCAWLLPSWLIDPESKTIKKEKKETQKGEIKLEYIETNSPNIFVC